MEQRPDTGAQARASSARDGIDVQAASHNTPRHGGPSESLVPRWGRAPVVRTRAAAYKVTRRKTGFRSAGLRMVALRPSQQFVGSSYPLSSPPPPPLPINSPGRSAAAAAAGTNRATLPSCTAVEAGSRRRGGRGAAGAPLLLLLLQRALRRPLLLSHRLHSEDMQPPAGTK